MTPKKVLVRVRFEPRIFRSRGRCLNHKVNEAVPMNEDANKTDWTHCKLTAAQYCRQCKDGLLCLLLCWSSCLASTLRGADLGSIPVSFSRSSHTSDLEIGTSVATLPGYRFSAGTGLHGVSILWLGEIESFICNFCLSVAARTIVSADLFLRYTSILLGHYAVNKH